MERVGMEPKGIIFFIAMLFFCGNANAYSPPTSTCASDGAHANVYNITTNSWSCVVISGGGGGITELTGDGTASGSGSVSLTLSDTATARNHIGLGASNSVQFGNLLSGAATFSGNVVTSGGIAAGSGLIAYGAVSPFPTGYGDYIAAYRSGTYGLRILGYDGSSYKNISLGSMVGGNFGLVLTATGTSYFNAGNVGIGNTSPNYLLDVSGTTKSNNNITGTQYITSALLWSGTNTHAQLPSTKIGITVANVVNDNMWVQPVSDTKFGYNAMMMSATTGENTAIGGYAMQNVAPEGYYTPDYGSYGNGWGNVAVGFGAMRDGSNSGCTLGIGANSYNTAVGTYALEHTTCGWNNEAFGRFALNAITTGYENIGVGTHSFRYLEDGYYNVGIGLEAGDSNVSGHDNIFVGWKASRNATGSSNITIGSNAGNTLTTGNSNILIGTGTALTTPAATTSNFMNIGNLIRGDLSGKYVSIGASSNAVPTTNALTVTGTTSTTGMKVTGISGSTQCVQASSDGTLSGTGAACGSGGGTSVVFQIPPEETPDILDTAGRIFPHVYVGAGGNASPREKVTGVMASLSANATVNMRFPLPMTIPSGTMKLKLVGMASATSGAAKVTIADGVVADGSSPSAATLTSETQQTVTWASGDTDKYKVTKVTLTPTPTAGGTLAVAVTFNNTSWTLAALSGWKFYLIWE